MSDAPWIQFAADCLERADEAIRAAIGGLDEEQLRWRPDADANPAGWLCWHVSRVLDDHLAELGGVPQRYPEWADRIGAPYPLEAHGYGMTSEDVAAFSCDAGTLLGYW